MVAALALVAGLPARLIAAGSSAGYHFHSLIAAGGPGHDQANAVVVDAQGHVHLAGSFEGTARFGSTNIVSAGRSDAFLARYDTGGELLWVRAFGSTDSATATAVAVDPEGCSLVAGHFLRDLDLGGVWLTNRGSYDGFVAKVDPRGTLLWTVQVGGALDDRVNAIAVDGTGHTTMAGHFMNTVEFGSDQLTTTGNFPDIFVARITPGGEVLWAAQGGGPLPDDAFGVAVDAVGNSVVVGTVAGTNTFGSLTLTNPAQARIVVAACDPHGQFQWASSGGSDRPDSANAVALGPDGAVLVTGAFGGPATLEGLALTNDATRYTFTARYAADGTLDWLTAHPGQEARAVAVSPAGQFVVAGSFTGAQSFGSHLLTSAGAFDWFVLGHDSMGGIEWARAAGGPHMDYVHALAPGLGADLWFAGRGTTNATFDHLVLTNAQRFDLLVARLSPAPLIREQPLPVVARAGAQIGLRVVAVGTEPLTYQWYHGTTGLLPEAREPLLLLDPALPEHSGLYTVIVSNSFGSATHDPVSVTIFGLAPPEVRIDGETGETFEFTDVPSVLVSIDASEPDLVLYYTLDGTQPTFGSSPYAEPFALRHSATVRAIAYAPDLASAEAEPVSVTLALSPPTVTVDGRSGPHLIFTNATAVPVMLQASLAEATLVYTLDDSDPTPDSLPYDEPFALTHSAVIRAMVFTPELGSATADPVTVEFFRTHLLSITAPGDGAILLNPPGGVYGEGSTVQLKASPAPGWEFMRWTGDLDTTEPMTTLLMDNPKTVGAVFGTRIERVSDGSGTVHLDPAHTLFARGTGITATGHPELGYFFARWTGAASGTNNPVQWTVQEPNPILVASFSPLPSDTYTLTINTHGHGSVRVEPRAPFYHPDTAVVLTALPDQPEAKFLLWTGAVTSPDNPLALSMTTNRTIHAYFTGAGFLRLEVPELSGDGAWQFRVRGDPGRRLLLQVSTNLGALPAWSNQLTFTNITGTDTVTTPALSQPGPVLHRVTAADPAMPGP